MRSPLPKPTRNQKGVVLLWTTFFLMVMIGCVALGIDVAKVMATRSQLQNAADAAALAGASAINAQTALITPGIAKSRAYATGNFNDAFTANRTAVAIDTTNDVVIDNNAHTVWVKVRRQNSGGTGVIPTFAHAIGITTFDVTAQATAIVEPAGQQCRGLVPFAAQPPPGQQFQTGCGNVYILKVGGGAGSNGAYAPVQFPPCPDGPCGGMNQSGASTYRCLLGNGYGCCVEVGDCLPSEQGNMSGPTRQAIQDRFNRDTDGRPNLCYSQYTGNGARLINVPITRPLNGNGGNACYQVIGLGTFFVKAVPANGNESIVYCEYVDAVVPGGGGGGGGYSSFALRLIK